MLVRKLAHGAQRFARRRNRPNPLAHRAVQGRYHYVYGPYAEPSCYLGDSHATQGDGELCGVAVEMASSTTIRVDLIKGMEDRMATTGE